MAVAVLCMCVFMGVMMSPSASSRLHKTEVKSLNNAVKICLACRQYSREHDGHYPPTLDTLFPKYLQDRGMLASPVSPADPNGYIYTPPTPALVDSPDTVVLEDKFAQSLAHQRVVVYANSAARIIVLPDATP